MMQIVVRPNGRVQRDGPSPAQQAQQAAIDELSASLASTAARIQKLVADGAEQTQAGRNELSEARREMAETAMQLRELADAQRQSALQEAMDGGGRVVFGRGVTGVGRSTSGTQSGNDIPDLPPGIVDVSMLFFVCMAAAIILTPLMRAFGRIIERRAAPPQRLSPDIEQQLTRMEQAIETVALEVERVSEGQRYATKLLTERERLPELRS